MPIGGRNAYFGSATAENLGNLCVPNGCGVLAAFEQEPYQDMKLVVQQPRYRHHDIRAHHPVRQGRRRNKIHLHPPGCRCFVILTQPQFACWWLSLGAGARLIAR